MWCQQAQASSHVTQQRRSWEIEECESAIMMEGLKKRTRKAFGIRKKEKDSDSTGSPDRDGSTQKKTNGAPNGFYGEIDWDRYNSPEVDEEGYSIRPEDDEGDILLYHRQISACAHFFSSSESEEEEEHRKKFNIKIKPLPADSSNCTEPTVDELKASIGNISLSPSPLRRSPGLMKRNISSEEIARPRRPTPTPTLKPGPGRDSPSRTAPSPKDATGLFGPPLETAFEAQKTEAIVGESEVWGGQVSHPRPDSPQAPAFRTGSPPPLPPKIVPASSPPSSSPSADSSVGSRDEDDKRPTSGRQDSVSEWGEKTSITEADNVFGPVQSSQPEGDAADSKWVSFSDESPDRPLHTQHPAPPLPTVPPPGSPPRLPSGPPPEEASNSPHSPPPSSSPSTRSLPLPLVLGEEDRRSSESSVLREDPADSGGSPRELTSGPRATPPPPPPPTYRAVVSSPGPYSGSGTGSGSSSPARPATPLSGSSPTPPPPPPRPPSRPKPPPGKPSIGDVTRPFSPPIHSSSPPLVIAPLARAESTSSISSTNSQSAVTTPTVGKELSISVSESDQPSLVWFDRGKFYLTFEGCSRGPSPLTMGAQDTLPVAAAFTETVNAYFKGADPSKCVVKITGEMVLSFPAGITRHFANNPSPAILTFSITNYSRLEHVLPNPQLLCCDGTQSTADTKEFWVNMPNLMIHLKKVAEQKPQATYYNVDMLKYQVSAQGIQSTPLNLAVNWRCEPATTDLRIDYKYNGEAMTTPVALHNVQFLVPVDGGVTKLQAVLPPAAWNAEHQRILWKIPDISQKSENGGVGSLLARFQLTDGPSNPAALALQFTSEGSTLSGCDIQLVGGGYRFSLIKKRFAAGKYMADN
ncbi:hypothetical protein GJAV_G00081720 [Gymnothorax javanicus]|nr:hypothetical protein GJAV_G00081720 [Gymnothorax javanicus]